MKSKSGWTEEALRIAGRMWIGGSTGSEIESALLGVAPQLSRAAIVTKMRRVYGVGSNGRKPGGVSRTGRPTVKVVKPPPAPVRHPTPMVATGRGVPLTEAGTTSCHRVIGDVVRRGVSLVCGNPVEDPRRLFCPACMVDLWLVYDERGRLIDRRQS